MMMGETQIAYLMLFSDSNNSSNCKGNFLSIEQIQFFKKFCGHDS